MQNFYIFCSIFGGTFVVLQFVMTLLGGFGGDDVSDASFETGDGSQDLDLSNENVSHDSFGRGGAATELLKILSFRTITAGLAFFGLAGLAGQSAQLSSQLTFFISLFAGFVALLLVYFLYRFIRAFHYDGSINEKTLLNCNGTVYVRIPANGQGVGKIMVNQQERTMEYEAVTEGDQEIKSGTQIVVVKILSSTQVVVAPR